MVGYTTQAVGCTSTVGGRPLAHPKNGAGAHYAGPQTRPPLGSATHFGIEPTVISPAAAENPRAAQGYSLPHPEGGANHVNPSPPVPLPPSVTRARRSTTTEDTSGLSGCAGLPRSGSDWVPSPGKGYIQAGSQGQGGAVRAPPWGVQVGSFVFWALWLEGARGQKKSSRCPPP